MSFKVQLFGEFKVWREGKPIDTSQWKPPIVIKLFQLLVSEPGRVFTNEQLIRLFWPKSEPEDAFSTLRNRISELRRLMEPKIRRGRDSAYIISAKGGYMCSPVFAKSTDIQKFKLLVDKANQATEKRQIRKSAEYYRQALRLYKGHFLESENELHWVLQAREHYSQLHIEASLHLVDLLARKGKYTQAIEQCQKALAFHPTEERIFRALMLFHYRAGNQTEAIHTYDACQQALRTHLSLECSPETTRLHKQIELQQVPGIDERYPEPRIRRQHIPHTLSSGSLPFVGRQKELENLANLFEQASRGQGRVVMLCGEAGVGKTRLVHEFVAALNKRNKCLLLQGRASAVTQPDYHPWAEVLQEAVRRLRSWELDKIPASHLAEVARIVPSLRGNHPGLPMPPPLVPQQEQRRFFEGVCQFIFTLPRSGAAKKTIVLAFEDLQCADISSLELLDLLASQMQDQALLIISTYRTGDLEEAHNLNKLLAKWEQQDFFNSIDLGRLSLAEVARLADKLPLQAMRIEAFSAKLYSSTEGNPLFLISLLQHLFETGALRVKGGRWVRARNNSDAYKLHKLPSTIDEIIKLRFQRLRDPERQALRLASVIGRECDMGLLHQAHSGTRESLEEAVVGLSRAQLLAVEERACEFSHEKVREAVYQEMPDLIRKLLHRQVMQAVEKRQSSTSQGVGMQLAYHALQAGDWRAAAEHAAKALSTAVSQYRWQEGLQLAEWGLEAAQQLEAQGEQLLADALRFELLLKQEDMLDNRARRDEQEKTLSRLEEVAGRLGDPAKLSIFWQKKSLYCLRTGRLAEAIEAGEKASALLEGSPDRKAYADCLQRMGIVHFTGGKYREALERFEKAMAIYREIGDMNGFAICLAKAGAVHDSRGKFEEALRCLNEALEIQRRAGLLWDQSTALNSIAIVYARSGKGEQAVARFKELMELHEQMGITWFQADMLNNIGSACFNLGKYDEALSYQKQALELHKKYKNLAGQAMSLNNTGTAYTRLGRLDEALMDLLQSLKIRQEMGNRLAQAKTLHNIAVVQILAGQYGEAEKGLKQSLEIRRELGDIRDASSCLYDLGSICSKQGKREEAMRFYQEAMEMARSVQHRWSEAHCLAGIGGICLMESRYREAEEHLRKACEILREMDSKYPLIPFLSMEALAHLGLGNEETALSLSTEAVGMMEQGIIHPEAQLVFFNHSKILSTLGRDDKSLEYLQIAYEESMRQAQHFRNDGMREDFLKNVKTNQDILKEWERRQPKA